MTDPEIRATRHSVPDSTSAIYEEFYERGWIDGLPIVPPTEARVREMLAGTAQPRITSW